MTKSTSFWRKHHKESQSHKIYIYVNESLLSVHFLRNTRNYFSECRSSYLLILRISYRL